MSLIHCSYSCSDADFVATTSSWLTCLTLGVNTGTRGAALSEGGGITFSLSQTSKLRAQALLFTSTQTKTTCLLVLLSPLCCSTEENKFSFQQMWNYMLVIILLCFAVALICYACNGHQAVIFLFYINSKPCAEIVWQAFFWWATFSSITSFSGISLSNSPLQKEETCEGNTEHFYIFLHKYIQNSNIYKQNMNCYQWYWI